ncbi:MAG: AAA family ATPase [Tabrizicola sp.]|jgi:class 3 adenylate cyclase/tetratricopeptide (TPR) repeat protein|nr:AAA family ATPase [Tabrizicola sp.]
MTDQGKSQFQDLNDWLSSHGLGHLYPALSEADVTTDLLGDLSDEDFRELGISLGDRKRLQRALGAATPAATPPPPESLAERRHMSIMFVDLVDSTRISREIDPEEMAELLRAYQNAVAGVIARFNGYVAKFMGDGVKAYFGWPIAREDDVQQAIRAGLAAIEEVGKLSASGVGAMASRVGIATGLVVVGDIVGSDEARERTATGETPNLAARLEKAAGRNRVAISDATARLVANNFHLQQLGEASLKGFDDAESAWEVIGERDHGSRYDARSSGIIRPILGRDREIKALMDCWSQVASGTGTAALIVAEAGIGKSRLVRAVLDKLVGTPLLPMQLQCSPVFSDRALWPVVQYLRRLLDPDRLAALKDPDARAAYLSACFGGADGSDAETVALFAQLLGIDAGQGQMISTYSAQQIRHRTLEALVARWRAVSADRPIFFEIEDIHWADPTTLQLIDMMLKAAPDSRSLTVLTSRPVTPLQLDLPAGSARIELRPLDTQASRQVAFGLFDAAGIDVSTLPDSVVQAILSRTDGNPLFIEELIKAVIAKRALHQSGDASDVVAVPETLQEMLMARLDHMRDVKAIVQTASCIGREFEPGLLAAIVDRPEPDLQEDLDRLEAAELIFRGRDAWVFKHALIRDAAYDSLLHSTRRAIHGRIVQHLQARAEPHPDLIAQHAELAGAMELAIANYELAGADATRRSANAEAISAYGNALRCIRTLPESPGRDANEIRCLIAMGAPIIASRGYAAEAVGQTYARARDLCERIGARAQLFDALRGLWSHTYDHGKFDTCLQLTATLMDIADELGGGLVKSIALRAHGSTNLSMDRFAEAQRAYEGSIEIADRIESRRGIAIYGENPAISARIMLAQVFAFAGRLSSAWEVSQKAGDLARSGDPPISVAQSEAIRAIIAFMRRDYPTSLEAAEEEASVSHEHGFVRWHAHSKLMTGIGRAFTYNDLDSLDVAKTGIDDWKATGATLYVPTFSAYLGDCALQFGRVDLARQVVDDGIAHAMMNREYLVLSELQRLDALIYERAGSVDEALSRLQISLATSQRQGAWLFHLRAATERVRIVMEQDQVQTPAIDTLRHALDLVTEYRSGLDWLRGQDILEKATRHFDLVPGIPGALSAEAS